MQQICSMLMGNFVASIPFLNISCFLQSASNRYKSAPRVNYEADQYNMENDHD